MQFVIAPDHPCLPGHFPGRPVVPGVVILEHVLAAIAARGGAVEGGLRLPQVKFVRPLLPGQEAEIELAGQAPAWTFAVRHAGELVASGRVAEAA